MIRFLAVKQHSKRENITNINMQTYERKTSIVNNAKNCSATNLVKWNKFIAIKHKYLVKLVYIVVIKNAGVVKNI